MSTETESESHNQRQPETETDRDGKKSIDRQADRQTNRHTLATETETSGCHTAGVLVENLTIAWQAFGLARRARKDNARPTRPCVPEGMGHPSLASQHGGKHELGLFTPVAHARRTNERRMRWTAWDAGCNRETCRPDLFCSRSRASKRCRAACGSHRGRIGQPPQTLKGETRLKQRSSSRFHRSPAKQSLLNEALLNLSTMGRSNSGASTIGGHGVLSPRGVRNHMRTLQAASTTCAP